jgi:hypothetical protein
MKSSSSHKAHFLLWLNARHCLRAYRANKRTVTDEATDPNSQVLKLIYSIAAGNIPGKKLITTKNTALITFVYYFSGLNKYSLFR